MGSLARIAIGSALAGTALTATPASAAGVIRVPCSGPALSAAINTANALGIGTVRLAPNCVYSVTNPAVAGVDALPQITGNVTLLGGPSTTIQRAPAATTDFRILEVAAGGVLSVHGIALLNGSGPAAGGGAILDNGVLELDRTTLAGSTAPNGGAISIGAAAHAVITRSLIRLNSTSGSGGGIINLGVLTLSASRVTANTAGVDGGGIDTIAGGTTRVLHTTIDRDIAGGDGGGVVNAGTTTLDHTLIVSNQAGVAGGGGGVFDFPGGTVTARRSIIRANVPNNCVPLGSIPGCTG